MKARPKHNKNLRVGSGITSYSRGETLYDDYHEKALAGALVPSDIPIDPARDIEPLRGEIELLCGNIFAEHDIKNPMQFVHPGGKFSPLEWAEVAAKGPRYIEDKSKLGYVLRALLYVSPEDHSPLWYAARMCVVLAQIDFKYSELRFGLGDSKQWALDLTKFAVELGRLEGEFRLKSSFEDSALLGRKVSQGGSAGGNATAKANKAKRKRIVEKMRPLVQRGLSVLSAGTIVFEQHGLGTSAAANQKIWSRYGD